MPCLLIRDRWLKTYRMTGLAFPHFPSLTHTVFVNRSLHLGMIHENLCNENIGNVEVPKQNLDSPSSFSHLHAEKGLMACGGGETTPDVGGLASGSAGPGTNFLVSLVSVAL